MSRHDEVSCDSCMDSNFVGKRYKCLVCYDYDLCSNCFDRGAVSANHLVDHPVQCLLAPNDLELYYGTEGARHVSSFTCPLCGQTGYSVYCLREHVLADHAFDVAREVICPICVATSAGPTYDQNHFTDEFALHMEHDHRSDSLNEGELRPRTESEGSSGELRTALDRQMARRGTGRIASRSSRASRLIDSTNSGNEDRSMNLVRGRGIFRDREIRDRDRPMGSSTGSSHQQQQQMPGGLRLVANLREHSADPLAELLSHMANSRAVIYDSSGGRGRGRASNNAAGGLAMLAPSGGSSMAVQLEQQLQSARSLLEELQHLERLPQRNQPTSQNRAGNVVLITSGDGNSNISQSHYTQQMHHPGASSSSKSSQVTRSSNSSVLSRWCEERERAIAANVWGLDDAKSRALFVQEALLGLMTASCKETIL